MPSPNTLLRRTSALILSKINKQQISLNIVNVTNTMSQTPIARSNFTQSKLNYSTNSINSPASIFNPIHKILKIPSWEDLKKTKFPTIFGLPSVDISKLEALDPFKVKKPSELFSKSQKSTLAMGPIIVWIANKIASWSAQKLGQKADKRWGSNGLNDEIGRDPHEDNPFHPNNSHENPGDFEIREEITRTASISSPSLTSCFSEMQLTELHKRVIYDEMARLGISVTNPDTMGINDVFTLYLVPRNIMALGNGADGRQEIFYLKDNVLYHRFQDKPNGAAWIGEFPFYGVRTTQIALGRNANGTQELFYVDLDGTIKHFVQPYPNSSKWDGPFNFYPETTGNYRIKQIALGRGADGRQELFYLRGNRIRHFVQDGPNAPSWQEFDFLDTRASYIALGAGADGRQEIFYIRNGEIFHRFQEHPNSSNWSGEFKFYDTGTAINPVTQIALGRNANGTQEIFYLQHNEIFHRVQRAPNSAEWDGPFDFYATKANYIALGKNANGTQELFYVDPTTGKINHRFQPTVNASNWSANFPFYETKIRTEEIEFSPTPIDISIPPITIAPPSGGPSFA